MFDDRSHDEKLESLPILSTAAPKKKLSALGLLVVIFFLGACMHVYVCVCVRLCCDALVCVGFCW